MTFPDGDQVTSSLERWGTRIMLFCVIGTCVCLIGFAYLQVRVSGQAGEGKRARQRQQAVYPVSLKVYTWASKDPRSHVTAADLACFKDSQRCPAPKQNP